jgi:hypothetical protein
MDRYTLGSARIAHGESATFTLIVSEPGVVAGLYPEEGSRVECAGQLGPEMRCAVYYELTAHWNVSVGETITEDRLPFTVTVTVSLRAWYGEYYPERLGQPCPGYSMWVYPELYYEILPTLVAAPPTIPLPPEVAPPVIAPPEVAPPVIAPPEVAPPVIAPPEVAPPVIAPPEVVTAPPTAPPPTAPPKPSILPLVGLGLLVYLASRGWR